MLFEKRYKSKLGYSVGEDDEIDSYGADHSGFTTRDEVAYQTARNDRENDLIENYNKRGITDNYPQYGRNFWGSSPENNYGFGSSNITDNIETVKNRFNTSGAENGYNQFFNYNNADNYRRYQDVNKPSSYLQSNSSKGFDNPSNILNGLTVSVSNDSGLFNQSKNNGTTVGLGTTPAWQNQTQTPWSYNEPRTTPTPWSDQTTIHVTPTPWADNSLTEAQRIQALKNGENLHLHINENPDWNGQWAKHCWKWVGKYYVDKYNDEIEKYATQANLDPDKLRAVMFTENACGNYGGANYLSDVLGLSGSQLPMNIQGKTWGNFQGRHYDTKTPEQNIELSALLLKQIENSLDNPTMDRITTIWNKTGRNQVSPFGGHGQIAYDTKPWLGEKQWEQKLLEFFFKNKKK